MPETMKLQTGKIKGKQKEGSGSEEGRVSSEIRRGAEVVFASTSTLPGTSSTPLPQHKQGRAVPINAADRGKKITT